MALPEVMYRTRAGRLLGARTLLEGAQLLGVKTRLYRSESSAAGLNRARMSVASGTPPG